MSTSPGLSPLCGGTAGDLRVFASLGGLSPPVRGNQQNILPGGGRVRSIPACAGEPGRLQIGGQVDKVYPRLCGGTFNQVIRDNKHRGLSPPVRGNLQEQAHKAPEGGSIPACAGEPYRFLTGMYTCMVYPRLCGEPAAAEHGYRVSRVYPRLCGGTKAMVFERVSEGGLSPPVRGNPSRQDRQRFFPGSIPACAGEPYLPISKPLLNKVYPRLCGGTLMKSSSKR